nr:tyrosine-type recombinase/integrase [uncultured Psychroserpens sp.]
MARLNFFLLDPKSKTNTPLFLSITYSGNRVKLKTKQKIKPTAWNKSSKTVRKNWTEYADVQIELNRIELLVKNTIKVLIDKNKSLPNSSELKKILETKVFVEDVADANISFWSYYEEFMDKLKHKKNPRTGKPITKATIEQYNQTFNTLIDFENVSGKTISFMLLSNDLYDDIVKYLEKLNFTPNTIGKHIKHIKSVINNARDNDGISISENYRDKYWSVTKQNKTAEEIVFLNESELDELWNIDLSNKPMLDKARDVFLVGSWTALRISDILKLKLEHIDNDDIIRIHTQKTDKTVSIPLHNVVKKILKKYDGCMPQISEQKVNESIKIVCEKLISLNNTIYEKKIQGNKVSILEHKRYQKVTTHTGRRSFASNMHKKGISTQTIMAITGHKKEADLYRYIGITNDELAKDLNEKFKKWYND